jgi:spore coat polysaccharide biosynthesis predicted glycosyltransferase SpsG
VSVARVVLVTDAGAEAGLGHLKRCAALAQALAARGCAVQALVAGPRDAGLAAVAPGLAVTALDWWGAPGRVLDAATGADAFVVDSYHADATLLTRLRRVAPVVAIDDLAEQPLPVDVVVNGAWHAERLGYRVPAGTLTLLGPRYALLDRAFAEAPSRIIDAQVRRVLVTLGGATPADDTMAAVSAVRAALPAARLDVVGGLVPAVAPSAEGVVIHGALPSLRPLLLAADLAITGGGMTLYECLATGTPTVAVGLADNQRLNLEHLGRDGFIVVAEFATLAATIARVAADRGLRERLSAGGRRAIDGQGADRVAAELGRLLATRVVARSG